MRPTASPHPVMNSSKTASKLALALFCVVASLFATFVPAQASTNPAPENIQTDNASCLKCHDSNQEVKVSGQDGKTRVLRAVKESAFSKSVHERMQCVACHSGIKDGGKPHNTGVAKTVGCVQCHTDLWEATKKANLTSEKARLGIVVKNIENYKNSFHARPNKQDKSRVNAACDDCHDTHTFSVPPQGTSQRSDWHLTIPNVCGEKCHTDELEEYTTSVHGKKVLEEHNPKAAVCTDCHTTHGIANTSKDSFKLSIIENCGSCHSSNLKSYRATYHGQVNKLGFGYTAKCYDCHGSHGILSPKDPESKVHPDNRLKTCQKCHTNASKGFVSFSPHATTHDFERYPQVWIVSRFMWALLAGVFAFFWLHTGLWWYREAKDRQARKNHPDYRKEAK